MVDINELDDDANRLGVLWSKTLNFAASFAETYQSLEKDFKSGKHGDDFWTFERWLIVKVGLTRAASLRMIRDFHKTPTDEQRKKVQDGLEEAQREREITSLIQRQRREQAKKEAVETAVEIANKKLEAERVLFEAQRLKVARSRSVAAQKGARTKRANKRTEAKSIIKKHDPKVPPDLKVVTQ